MVESLADYSLGYIGVKNILHVYGLQMYILSPKRVKSTNFGSAFNLFSEAVKFQDRVAVSFKFGRREIFSFEYIEY